MGYFCSSRSVSMARRDMRAKILLACDVRQSRRDRPSASSRRRSIQPAASSSLSAVYTVGAVPNLLPVTTSPTLRVLPVTSPSAISIKSDLERWSSPSMPASCSSVRTRRWITKMKGRALIS